MAEFRKRLCESSIYYGAVSFAIWLSKMLLATHSSAKTFSSVVKQAGASIPNSFYGNRRSEVPKKNGSAMTERVSLHADEKLTAFVELE
jgi:hypothetical protein